MSRADTLKQIADYFTGLGTLFEVLAADSATAPVSAARPVAADSPPAAPASFSDGTPIEEPFADEFESGDPGPLGLSAAEGSEAVCPKHRKPYKDGKYGPFCTSTSDDPAWSNKRGYCSITPKNAAQYMRVRAAA